MLQNLTGWHALIILAIVLLIFGAAKLPALAKSIGQSVRVLKDEARDGTEKTDAAPADAPTSEASAPPAPIAALVAAPAPTGAAHRSASS